MQHIYIYMYVKNKCSVIFILSTLPLHKKSPTFIESNLFRDLKASYTYSGWKGVPNPSTSDDFSITLNSLKNVMLYENGS